MMEILSKDMIEKWILPHVVVGKRGFSSRVPLYQVVMLILYRLKTGCQWRQLPIKQFFESEQLTWQGVYYEPYTLLIFGFYFNRWSKRGCFEQVWVNVLKHHHAHLDLSSAQLDGSHTPAKNGGEAVGYQGRKAAKTTNGLFLADNQGVLLAMATSQEGQHHDLFEIQTLFSQLTKLLQAADMAVEGVFLVAYLRSMRSNADPGFDGQALREVCEQEQIQANIKPNPRNKTEDSLNEAYFDEELSKRRVVIEQANAWRIAHVE